MRKEKTPLGITESQLQQLEREYPQGLTAFQIRELLASHGVKLGPSNFSRWVQFGLLPQSRRVSRARGKAKHHGTEGFYPACTVRFILIIRERMNAGLTIRDIQRDMQTAIALAALDEQCLRVIDGLENACRAHTDSRLRDKTDEVQRMRRAWYFLRARLTRIHRELAPAPIRSTPCRTK